MGSMWRGPVVVLLLLVCRDSLEAGDRDDDASVDKLLRRNVREPAWSASATEVEDLLGEGNSPEKEKTGKKGAKNASGMLLPIEFQYLQSSIIYRDTRLYESVRGQAIYKIFSFAILIPELWIFMHL